ncbi:MAG TPA: 2-oxoglutarate dehydrogenase complex dihydrolipoyllysine-residue succinyltransferase [Candidatus Acidoferrum sp.]|nr:2-oxoglutarate dehydrogenase complex dihydrolipoyllysine-residue succinyltransferase [Candidatus Acidoferrum sp.]
MDVTIPEVGESIVEVQIGEWLKHEGDAVRKDDSLAMIESEKTNFELPAPAAGKLARILAQPGETVKVGATIAQIEPGSDGAQAKQATAHSPKPSAPKPAAATTPSQEPQPDTQAPHAAPLPIGWGEGGRRPGEGSEAAAESEAPPVRGKPARPPTPRTEPKPAARAPAAPPPAPIEEPATEAPEIEETQPPETAEPKAPPPETAPAPPRLTSGRDTSPRRPSSGGSGRLGEASLPAGREEEVVPMSMLRRTVARRLLEAQRTMAMLTTFNEVDMAAVQALRHERQEAFQQRYQVKLGLMSFFVKAAVAALKEFPQINAEVRGDDIIYRNYFDIGVAIASPQGLVVPVLPNAERLSFAEIESAVADFARRAKERRLKPEELEGGTFTITNGGVFGSLLSTPIINPPQSGILGLHAITDRPVARAGAVVIRPMMYVALTYDHRIVDGREAVLFLRRIKELVEDPARMLIEA